MISVAPSVIHAHVLCEDRSSADECWAETPVPVRALDAFHPAPPAFLFARKHPVLATHAPWRAEATQLGFDPFPL